MAKSFKKTRGPFFIMPAELLNGRFKLNNEMTETKLSEYLGLDGIYVYGLIGSKQNGKSNHDSNLICTSKEASHLMCRTTFSKAVHRLWAYRMIAVHEWGGGKKHSPSRYQLISKWKTLIRMPERLERIYKLVVEREKLLKLKINSADKKRLMLISIDSKIRKVIV